MHKRIRNKVHQDQVVILEIVNKLMKDSKANYLRSKMEREIEKKLHQGFFVLVVFLVALWK